MTSFAAFIVGHVDAIVADWEAFAKTTGFAAAHLSSHELQDHAKVVLLAVAADMETAQSRREQHDKSVGQADGDDYSGVKRTTCLHAEHRFQQGFSLTQMVSEYRALRASIIRRWIGQTPSADTTQLDELVRFGEALDEGLTEAIRWYSHRLEESRSLLIGVLAHDLRSPLGAVRMSAEYLLRGERLVDGELLAATRIVASAGRMTGYIDDLLDFTQTLLGDSLHVVRAPLALGPHCHDVIEEVRASHPTATIRLDVRNAPVGAFDAGRLSQLISNLVVNAVIHGDAGLPITVTVERHGEAVQIAVHNLGEPIDAKDVPGLFRPLMQGRPPRDRRRGSSGLGLGLYIAREIAMAHGGTLTVTSDLEHGTTFTAQLPLH